MSSRPRTPREATPGSSQSRLPNPSSDRYTPIRNIDLDRALPPLPSSSLPTTYEIPTLRQRPSPSSTNGTPVKHGRSVSHPFPSLFGGKRTDKRQHDDDFDSSDGGTPTSKKADAIRSGVGSNSKTPLAMRADRQPQTGKCMTCDSTVRWPQELKIFRCTTCLTINDLEPYEEHYTGEGSAAKLPPRKPMPISLDRTKRMIDQCLNEYFDALLTSNPTPSQNSVDEIAVKELPAIPVSEPQRPMPPPRRPSEPLTNLSILVDGMDVQTLGHTSKPVLQQRSRSYRERPGTAQDRARDFSGPEVRPKDPASMVFRALESYVTGCFSGSTALNISFFTMQPAGTSSERRDVEPDRPRKTSDMATTSQLDIQEFVAELDAKILLLGDVVENGSWWAGSRTTQTNTVDEPRDKSPERWRGIVSAKSPRINWTEVTEWYQLIAYAGHDWQRRWNSLYPSTSDSMIHRWRSVEPRRIEQEISESQLHLQRTLLKATENLLKRPRRPLKNPEDCRFLLILLANPLLHSPSHTMQTSSLTSVASASKASNGLGHHSGIIKRTMGLMANLPNEVHQFLVSWISRFSDGHFQKLVDIVSAFMTYRLTRQQDRVVAKPINPTAGLVPTFSDSGVRHASELHAALEVRPSNSSKKKQDGRPKVSVYSEDWQIRAAARVMSLLFQANSGHVSKKRDLSIPRDQRLRSAGLNAKYQANSHGQIVPISTFYNTMLDHADLVADFEAWETTKSKFTFCQYPFFMSIWAKIHILEHDARRQMEVRAREAFFDSILSRKAVSQYLVLKVRRDCLVEDSLKNVSEVIGSGSNDIKKGLRIDFVGEEGIDAGGLRKEWFLSLVREIFDPHHGLFVYDEDSHYCYFNPHCFESSEQFFLVGVLLGLAIYNSTILDVAFPPFVFKKLLASAPFVSDKLTSVPRVTSNYTLEDLAEFRPALAKGLRQLLEYNGNVQETFCRDFVIETERYGEIVQVPLCTNGHKRAITNSNRRDFVDLYIRYLLDTAVARQYEPFKRGFFTVCGGNALSLFRPEEIELLVRGSDEPLDVASLRVVAAYENWPKSDGPPEAQAPVVWFWECFERASPTEQRKLLSFITGSDRIPAMGATNLNIKLQFLRDADTELSGREIQRFPIARTCFNTLGLYRYRKRETLETKLWMAVYESEGFGLK